MGNSVPKYEHANTVHYDHYGHRVGFAEHPWDPEGAPWNPPPTPAHGASAVNIPRRPGSSRTDPHDFTPGSAETYLEFLQNKFGTLPPSVANGIANGEIDVERFLKNRELDTLSGDFSMMGNFSPTSLYEKNIHFSDTDSPEGVVRRRITHSHPLSDSANQSPELGRRSASPTLYRRTKEFDSPFKRSVRSAGSNEFDDDELDSGVLFSDESQVNTFFDKLEQELLSLKSEIEDMDDTIEKLSSVPERPRDLGQAGQVLRKYKGSGRNSRAGSVTSDRPTPCDTKRTFSDSDERTHNTVFSSSPCTTSNNGNNAFAPYHVHVHVHVHDEKKNVPVDLPLRYPALLDRDEESMSSSSLADSQPISAEPSPSRDEEEPIGATQDVTNNNGFHDILSSTPRDQPRPQTGAVIGCNVGEVCDVITYADREWRGNTDTAKTMLKGYHAIPDRLTYSRLRRIRGDQYCAIRATLYQIFTSNVDFTSKTGSLHDVTEILHSRLNDGHQYLRAWSFAHRLSVTSPDHVTSKLADCLQALYNQQNALSCLNCTERVESYCVAVNSAPDVDVKMMEAVKLLMMLNAIQLHEMCTQGKEVPLFVWLMYARDTSPDPRSLFLNHIDGVGDRHGLEQVEMFLLADTLGVVVEVVRPSHFGEDDYITYFPSATDHLPKLTLIAEDDRHYNVLVP